MRLLVERLEHGIFPWMWDWPNYSGKKKDMVGFFYEEDLQNMEQIDAYEREYARTHKQR